jgi:thiosulfate/3-mercaptopyruvate sulfurtransferase
MTSWFRFPGVAALLLGGAAASAVAQSEPPGDSLLVTPAWLAQRLADPELVVLQVDRDRAGYQAGHIPGARFVPLDAIVVARDAVPNELLPPERLDSVLEAAGVSTGSRMVIYGDPLAAARMFFTLDYLGVGGRAALLDGGLPKWKAEGFPLSVETWQGLPGRLDVTLHPHVVVDAVWVHDHLDDPTAAILDARPEADFVPHIPGAGSLP